LPPGERVHAPNWDIQVLETVRGEAAWELLLVASPYNDPAPEGMEYLLIRLQVTCTYADGDAHSISGRDFKITGDRMIRYSTAWVVKPEPILDAELYSEGEAEGWAGFAVGEGEGNPILIVDELGNWDEDRFRFVALEDGASVGVPPELAGIQPEYAGVDRTSPIPLGEMGITEDWEITIVEYVRGDEAWQMAQEVNSFNEPPSEGMEYVAVSVLARYIGTIDEAQDIGKYDFDVTGSGYRLHHPPSVVDPEPSLDVWLYPGGAHQGWIMMQVLTDETDLMLVFEPMLSFPDQDIRFFALDDRASLGVPPDLAELDATKGGSDRRKPAPIGRMVRTTEWEVTVLEVFRGDSAWQLVEEANRYNEPPDEGMEYVAVRLLVRNISIADEARHLARYDFNATGSSNVLHDVPSLVGPEPNLEVSLYPGGEFEGWMILQATTEESGLVAVFDASSSQDTRYLSLEP
jgi:hypothetical protein